MLSQFFFWIVHELEYFFSPPDVFYKIKQTQQRSVSEAEKVGSYVYQLMLLQFFLNLWCGVSEVGSYVN